MKSKSHLGKASLSNLVAAGRLATCLHVSDVGDGDGVLLCVLLVPIHGCIEVRNRRNLPEMSMTMRMKKVLKEVNFTWLSTVSCSPFQPAMARPSPPSVSLRQIKLPLWQRTRSENINLKAATNLATSSMFQPTLGLIISIVITFFNTNSRNVETWGQGQCGGEPCPGCPR